MKVLIVVESKHQGNTRKIAEAMASAVPDAMVTDTAGAGKCDFGEYDLIGFGSGIYAGSFDMRITKLIDQMDGKQGKTFVFSTSSGGEREYNKKVIDLLTSKNKTVVGDFACKGLNKFFFLKLIGGVNKGYPSAEDLKNACDFIQSITK